MNQVITTAIRQLSPMIPTNSIHIYYESEQAARQESYRTGQPFFVSVIGGNKMYSVRVKI